MADTIKVFNHHNPEETPVGGLVQMPSGMDDLLSYGNTLYLKTGVLLKKSEYPDAYAGPHKFVYEETPLELVNAILLDDETNPFPYSLYTVNGGGVDLWCTDYMQTFAAVNPATGVGMIWPYNGWRGLVDLGFRYTYLRTTDWGVTWSWQTMNVSPHWVHATSYMDMYYLWWDGTKFIVPPPMEFSEIGYTSFDAITWTTFTLAGANLGSEKMVLRNSNGVVMMMDRWEARYWTSTDYVTWTQGTTPHYFDERPFVIDDTFMHFAWDGNTLRKGVSVNGTPWVYTNMPDATVNDMGYWFEDTTDVFVRNGKAYLYEWSGTCWTSVDKGATWVIEFQNLDYDHLPYFSQFVDGVIYSWWETDSSYYPLSRDMGRTWERVKNPYNLAEKGNSWLQRIFNTPEGDRFMGDVDWQPNLWKTISPPKVEMEYIGYPNTLYADEPYNTKLLYVRVR